MVGIALVDVFDSEVIDDLALLRMNGELARIMRRILMLML